MSERKMPSVDDYPSNAISGSPAKREKAEPVVHGKVKRKSSIFRSVKDEFISEDADTMGSYLLNDILFPALRDLINDICHGAIDAAFGGGGRSYRSRSRGGSYISYNRYYDDDRNRRKRHNRDDDYDDDRPRRRGGQINFEEYLFDSRGDAEDVLYYLCDEIEQFGDCPVGRFFDRRGETIPGNFTDEDWGWTNLAGTKVRTTRYRGEVWWWIDLPRIKPI